MVNRQLKYLMSKPYIVGVQGFLTFFFCGVLNNIFLFPIYHFPEMFYVRFIDK